MASLSGYTITISRQMGSLGEEIANLIANQFSCRLVHRELINQAAKRAGTPEAALAAIDELQLLGITPSQEDRQAYCNSVNQILIELASQGNVVILGRAGQIILANHPTVFHVRLYAPLAIRVSRIASRQGIATQYALAQVRASDKFRANYLKRFYHVRWDDPELYDLTLNTSRLNPVRASEIICHALESFKAVRLELSSMPSEPCIES